MRSMAHGISINYPPRKSRRSSYGGSLLASTVLSVEREKGSLLGRNTVLLNDQQWVLQRKKIGLSRKSKKTQKALKDSQKNKNDTISFFRVKSKTTSNKGATVHI